MSSFRPFVRFFTLDGAGATWSIVSDYSASPASFLLRPAADEVMIVQRLVWSASGPGSFSDFNVLPALTVGMSLHARSWLWPSAIQPLNLFGGEGLGLPGLANIKQDQDWERICYDVKQATFGTGAGARSISAARFSFDKFTSDPRRNVKTGGGGIALMPWDVMTLAVNDDFTGLDSHTLCAEGTIIEAQGLAQY